MEFGIYMLFFNRIDLSKTTSNINNIISSLSFKNRNLKLYLIDDCSNSEKFNIIFNNLRESYIDSNIIFVRNKRNFNIINNPINIFLNAREDYISLLADDDSIEPFHVDNFINSISSNKDSQIVCFVNDFDETIENKVISSWQLREIMNSSAFYRCLSFLFNQSDMYLYGFYSTKILKNYKFYGFRFFKKSPTSWAYTLPFFVLWFGKIKNIGSERSWKYNSKSDKQYLEYNESSKLLWYIKYILREIELHYLFIRYLPKNISSIFIILLMPIVFIHKNLKRILKFKI